MNRAIHTILAVAGASIFAAFSRAAEYAPLFEAPEAASASLKYGGEQLAFGAPAETPLEDTPECAAKRLVYTSPDGLLQVEREIRRYKKFPITEFKTTLRNVSKKSASKNLSDLCVYSLILKNNPDNIKSDKVKIRRLKGAATTMFDFAEETVVLERRPQSDSLLLENKTGYPASVWLPYFGADFDELNGALFAVGGCGNWSALFEIDRRNFSLKIGVPDCDFSLNPEESVSLPSVLVMRRQNMRIDRAQNIWRKFVFEHKTPKDAVGKPVCAPIYTSIGGNIPTEKLVNIADFARVHELPFSMYGVDAGWFGGAHVPKKKGAFGDWMQNAGDWRVNTNVHPQKLLPLAKAANAAGMKFSLWIEIERVMPQTPLWREHPEFLAPSPDNSRAVLNLGDKNAWNYAFETLSNTLEENGADVWRMDSNLPADTMSAAFDLLDSKSPNRRGIGMLKHAEGVLKLWDALKQKYPQMQFDNCASGGRRLDCESMSRTFVVWRSDSQCWRIDGAAESNQIQTFYLSSWLPSHTGGNGASLDDQYAMASAMNAGFFVSSGALKDASRLPLLREYFGWAQRIRKYIARDFYRLTQAPENFENWCAYQGHDPESGGGFVAAFRRRQSPDGFLRISPRGIDENAVYEIENKDGLKSKISGRDFKDLRIDLPPRDFQFLFYRKTAAHR